MIIWKTIYKRQAVSFTIHRLLFQSKDMLWTNLRYSSEIWDYYRTTKMKNISHCSFLNHTLSIHPLDSPLWSIHPSSPAFLWSGITSSIIWEVLILLFSCNHITVRILWSVHFLSFSRCIRKTCKCAWEFVQKTVNLKQIDRLEVKSNRPLTFLWTLPCALANLMSSLFLFFLLSSSFRTCSINFLKKSRSRRRFSSEKVHQFTSFSTIFLNT